MTEVHPVVFHKVREGNHIHEFSFTPDMLRSVGSDYIKNYRQKAWEDFKRILLPSTKDEAWRRTDIRGMDFESFKFPHKDFHTEFQGIPEALKNPLKSEETGGQVILYPGGYTKSMAQELKEKGVVFTDLLDAEENYPQIVEKILGRIVRTDEGKFSALAGAFSHQGVLLYIPKDTIVEQPFHSLLWGDGEGLAFVSHILVYLEDNSSATFIHEAASSNEINKQSMHAGLVEIYVGEGAALKFIELQSWGENMWNFSHERARVERDGSINWVFGAVGSRLTKNFTDLDLVGDGSSGKMSGFYLADYHQHMDHDTQQNHFAANTTSDLLFKGGVLGESRSVWQGMIYVAPGSNNADGYQANRNLILSGKARADSIPGLEILADDVRCTHAATVGQLDENQVFYLLSRGIPRDEAERLIVEGFFDQIMERIPYESVRDRFKHAIHSKMDKLKPSS